MTAGRPPSRTGRQPRPAGPARRLAASAGRLGQDEAGFVLVFFAVAIPAILGLVGLALDGISLMSLDTELAALADRSALAAASRLDRSDGAIPQAREAALALVPTSGTPGTPLTFRFAANLADLQGSESFSLADSEGAAANFVEVRTATASLTTSLLQLVGARAPPVQRRAVASSVYYACDVTPALLCVPNPAAFAAQARAGRQFLLRMDGNTVAGSIALLDRPDAVNDRQTIRTLASEAPRFCYADNVRLRTNVSAGDFDAAVNTRFDRYVSDSGPIAPDLTPFPPAPDVIQGHHLESCVAQPDGGDIDPPYALPRDSAFRGYRLTAPWDAGAGDWRIAPAVGGTNATFTSALEEYLAWNHADKGPDILDRFRDAPTRYDLYLAELGLTRSTETTPVDTRSLGPSVATMPTGGPITGPLSLRREHAVPVCYAGSRPAVEARRRILYLSIADCGAFPEAASAASLSRYVGKFFLTEPTSGGAALLELVGLLTPADDDGKYHHVVELAETD